MVTIINYFNLKQIFKKQLTLGPVFWLKHKKEEVKEGIDISE